MKSWFVKRAIDLGIFGSDWYFWADSGSVRDAKMMDYVRNFPNQYTISCLPKDKMTVISIQPFISTDMKIDTKSGIPLIYSNENKLSCKNIVRIQGGFFGGYKTMWPGWVDEYRRMLLCFMNFGPILWINFEVPWLIFLCLYGLYVFCNYGKVL